jgi:decaprenylphospho-beta-D-ribofuranose 2-oxidase
MSELLSHFRRVQGFGQSSPSDAIVFKPTNREEIQECVYYAKKRGFKIIARGGGCSYGDAAQNSEQVVLDLTDFNKVLHWDAKTGQITCESGVTLEQVWRHCLSFGYWPPVVTGTMFPTVGGMLAMNVHGKNNFSRGPIGEHVTSMDVLFANGQIRTLTPSDSQFFAVIGSAGLLGIILSATIQMHKVDSYNLDVYAESAKNWEEQLELFLKHERTADYMVSWIDCFGSGRQNGRGLFHSATYQNIHTAFDGIKFDLPSKIMGIIPKSQMWRIFKLLCNRPGMKFLNASKQLAGAVVGNRKTYAQTLVEYSFLLDYVPNWRNAYHPHGFIQYQSFVPKLHAARVFSEQVRMQQEAKLESFLGVLKRHRPDSFLLSHGVDGFSLALDFKVTAQNRERLWKLAHHMNELVIDAGGKFYFAKDSTLRRSDVERSFGPNFDQFLAIRSELDPDRLLVSDLATRLRI